MSPVGGGGGMSPRSTSSPDLTDTPGGGESPDAGRRRVCRTESVKTQNSLLLLEEKMELLADLQQKAEKCRLLEDQLENLGSQMNCVAKSRAELAQIKQEEVEGIDREDNTDQALLGHLDRKLGHLERQQHQLMDASLGVKASLTLQSEAQTVLTKRLIKKIGDFSCNNPGSPDSDGGSLSNIHSLALALEQHAVTLDAILQDRTAEILALKASLAAEGGSLEGLDFMGTPPPKIPSPIFSDIPEDLFTTLSRPSRR